MKLDSYRNPYPTKIMMKTIMEQFTLKQRIMAVFNNFGSRLILMDVSQGEDHDDMQFDDVRMSWSWEITIFLIFGNLKGWRECKGCVCWVKEGKGLWQFVFFKFFFVCFDSRCSSSHVGGRNRMMLFITRLNDSMNDTDL